MPTDPIPPFPRLENLDDTEWTDEELIDIGRRTVELVKDGAIPGTLIMGAPNPWRLVLAHAYDDYIGKGVPLGEAPKPGTLILDGIMRAYKELEGIA